MTPDDDTIDQLQSWEPEEGESPYESVDVSSLPDWWQRAIKEFEKAGLRPYRPPRLADGAYKHEIVDELEATFDVDIEFVGIKVKYGDDWTVRVDGEPVSSVGHKRTADGFSVFDINTEQLLALVQDSLTDEE